MKFSYLILVICLLLSFSQSLMAVEGSNLHFKRKKIKLKDLALDKMNLNVVVSGHLHSFPNELLKLDKILSKKIKNINLLKNMSVEIPFPTFSQKESKFLMFLVNQI